VVRAIKTDKAEIDVAPLSLRIGAMIGSLTPGLSTVMQARFGGTVSDDLVEAQRSKR
jgi:hypothetical protein